MVCILLLSVFVVAFNWGEREQARPYTANHLPTDFNPRHTPRL